MNTKTREKESLIFAIMFELNDDDDDEDHTASHAIKHNFASKIHEHFFSKTL